MTSKTTIATNDAGVPPAPPEAHQRAGAELIFSTTKEMIMNESDFLRMAQIEVGEHAMDRALGAKGRAMARLAGGIGQDPRVWEPQDWRARKEAYVKVGLEFLDEFQEMAAGQIELIEEGIEADKANDWNTELKEEIRDWMIQFKEAAGQVNREEFARLLAEDFQEFYMRDVGEEEAAA